MDKVWPQHQQRLEMALLEEAEIARKTSVDAFSALQRKRSAFFDSPYFVKHGSLTGVTIPKVPSRKFTSWYSVQKKTFDSFNVILCHGDKSASGDDSN